MTQFVPSLIKETHLFAVGSKIAVPGTEPLIGTTLLEADTTA